MANSSDYPDMSVPDLALAFATAPTTDGAGGVDCQACVFVVGGGAFDTLAERDWVVRHPSKLADNRKILDPRVRNERVTRYLRDQCEYPVLSAITGEGVLLTKFFPSPSMKSLLLSPAVNKKVLAIVFGGVSREYGSYFSAEDRNMLADLDSFGISLYYFSADAQAWSDHQRAEA
jgi:hypothetical protein